MVVLFILLTLVGLIMLFRPAVFWSISESWKSNDATEPSNLYIWSTRFGAVLCVAAGIGGVIASML
jgi:hypothetical protein